jgi:hypothetical protein
MVGSVRLSQLQCTFTSNISLLRLADSLGRGRQGGMVNVRCHGRNHCGWRADLVPTGLDFYMKIEFQIPALMTYTFSRSRTSANAGSFATVCSLAAGHYTIYILLSKKEVGIGS